MTPNEQAYARLLTAVWLAGLTITLDRMDAWLAEFETKPARDRHGIPENDDD